MNRKHKRKQILFTRSEHLEEEGSTMSSGYDPFMCAGPDKNEFLTEEPLISPTEWGMESISGNDN